MAKEAVQAVRQVELNALQTQKNAELKKDEIIINAEQKAKQLVATRTKQALAKAEQDLDAVNQKGMQLIEEAKQKAEKEVLALKEAAALKEQEAIKMIISCVIRDS